ncbi:DUF2746 domain-containing protein [Cryobacterium sp. Y62]|uniref:DUF2746 domain-containing protein n=1 Tax=Cryobacterium sp. Y62 TaxID=2048284 RepID=UPI000CE3C5DA|nr:DUF2746 domain-containing protein [Cryobacterium sp. Y62]
MTDGLEVALVGAVVAPCVLFVLAYLGRKLSRIESSAQKDRARLERIDHNSAVSRDQLANTHDTNLRDEQDDRHQENRDLLTRLVKTTEHQATAMGGMRDTLRTLADSDNLHTRRALLTDARIERLESTARKNGHTPIGLLP